MNRRSLAALAFALLTTLACMGEDMNTPKQPLPERSYYDLSARPTGVFKEMDLPYYGGMLEKCSKSFLEVTYPSYMGVTPEQLVGWWPAALRDEGWAEEVASKNADGGFSGTYRTPDGKGAVLSISPLGSLWVVSISIIPQD